ncbi:hypothetical protein [Streptomyces reniochalinae]|uniref:hypothetical protein n=1 Tax=Streptomyces reniochalinae TaxID=2250578 RepID=UPI0015F0034A|nr:hypothetical protein [Streptomyces reniochalinae]
MGWPLYITGLLLVVVTIVVMGAGISQLMHERRSLTDHGLDCFWCHPRLPWRGGGR